MSNRKIDDLDLVRQQAAFLVGERSCVVLTMDWTEYGLHGQNRLAINLVTRHGRGDTVALEDRPQRGNSRAPGCRNWRWGLLQVLKAVLPASVKQVIILADRGFGDVDLYDHIQDLGFDFVIRFRGCISVTAPDGRSRAGIGMGPIGRASSPHPECAYHRPSGARSPPSSPLNKPT